MIKKIRDFFGRFDVYQLLALPLVITVMLLSLDLRGRDIAVGVVLPLTGEQASISSSRCNGLQLAVSHINKLGGINGKKLRLELRDSRNDPETAAEAARDLIYESDVAAIIGGTNQHDAGILQYLAEKAQIPFLSAFCTHYEITANDSQFTFRTITDDQKQFEALAEFAARRFNSRKPALIYDAGLYGSESAQKLMETCARFGQQVCAAVSYKSGALNFRKQIELIQSSNPDLLVILAPPTDSAIILRQAREARFNHPVMGGNSMASPEFLGIAGVYSEGVVITLPFNARLGGQRAEYFLSEYSDIHGNQADADAAMSYESLMILALALKSGESDRLAVNNALHSLHGWESVAGSGGFDSRGNQVRPAEKAIFKERQKIPANLEELF
jgi:branched-chain amino acid transport system substrate-binding protein